MKFLKFIQKLWNYEGGKPIPDPIVLKKEGKWVTKIQQVEADSIDVLVVLFFNSGSNVSHIFKSYYGYNSYGYSVISGVDQYNEWLENNKDCNIISLNGTPYLLKNINDIAKKSYYEATHQCCGTFGEHKPIKIEEI
jgi:hypothetical protein